MKVYLSPSGQIHNVGTGDYGTEEARCRKVAELTAAFLKAAGVAVDMTPRVWNSTLADNDWLYRVVARSNAFGADVHVAIHTNAGGKGANGTDAWYYPGSASGKRLTEAIYKRVAAVSPGSDGGLHTSPVFYETRAADAPVCYIELAFHSDPADAKSVSQHPELYAKAIAEGILEYGGIVSKPAPVKVDYRELKQAMLSYALLNGLRVSGWERITILSPGWGKHAQQLAWRVSRRINASNPQVPVSARPTPDLAAVLLANRASQATGVL